MARTTAVLAMAGIFASSAWAQTPSPAQPSPAPSTPAECTERAVQRQHVYLDYAGVLADEKGMLKADLADDGLHPNAKGYAVMTPLAEKAVAAALEGRR